MSPANFESLPNEMLLEIVSLLPRDANASLSLVNHRLRSLTRAELFSQLTLSSYGPLRSKEAGEAPHAREKLEFWTSATIHPLVCSARIGIEPMTVYEDARWQGFPPFGKSYPQQLQALIFTQLPRFRKLTALTLSSLNLKPSDVAALLAVASLSCLTASLCDIDDDGFYNDDPNLPLHTWQLSTFTIEAVDETDADIWMALLDPAHLRTLHLPTATYIFAFNTVFPNVTRLSICFHPSAMLLNVEVMQNLPNVEHLTVRTSEYPYFGEPACVSFRAQCPLPSLRVLVLVEVGSLTQIFIPDTPITPPYPYLTTLTLPCSFFALRFYCERLQKLPALRFLWMQTPDDTDLTDDDWTTLHAFEEIVSLEIPLPNTLLAFALSIRVGIHELSATPIQPSMFWPAFKSRCPGLAHLWLVGDDFLIHSSADKGCVSYASEPVRQLRAKGQPIAGGDLGMYFAKRCSSEAELEAAQKELNEWWDRL